MIQVKRLDFNGINIYCGIDVHKKNWRVNVQDGEFELADFSQDPNPATLIKHLNKNYPNAKFKVCYEAGFSGFNAQRQFSESLIECLVLNAADVSTSHKERSQKSDKIDSRKLCNHLQSKMVKSIYIPSEDWEHSRSLVRARGKIVSNQTRCKNRIWQLLYFSGIILPKEYDASQYWSKRFINELKNVDCSDTLKITLNLYIQDYLQTRLLLLEATRKVRELCKSDRFIEDYKYLTSIPGVGGINAAVILFELQDVKRFSSFDKLSSYVGLVPNTSDSGETKIAKGITNRRNNYLRTALVECSWMLIRKDPAMLMKYKDYCKKMDKNKAIIRIAKHLLARINYVLKNKKEYVIGVV